jgi:hypothetical protein
MAMVILAQIVSQLEDLLMRNQDDEVKKYKDEKL